MIIPMVCFTCGKPIAHLWEQYLDLVKSFEIQRNQQILELGEDEDAIEALPTPEFMALMRLKIFRLCCRRMFLCQHDMYDKIK